MASPPDNSSILNGSISSSPRAVRADHSPIRRRQSVGSEINEASSRPRLSPTLSRTYNPNDPDARERQRTMDADMAMQLSRARSGTVGMPSPIAPVPTHPSPRRMSEENQLFQDHHFPALSLQEQQAIDEARGTGQLHVDVERPEQYQHPGSMGQELLTNHLSSGHDPALLVSLDAPYVEDSTLGGLPMYQATVDRADRPHYEFALMEAFARDEKHRLGIHTPSHPVDVRQSQASSSTHAIVPNGGEAAEQHVQLGEPASTDSTLPFTLPRTRHRKLSISSPAPRRGKMALFEQGTAPPPTLASRAPHLAMGTTLSAVPSYDNLDDSHQAIQDRLGLGIGGGPGSGHDRPYRFSFYSNKLSATIHARSMCELPAEGQTFQDLFQGPPDSNSSSNANSIRPSFLHRTTASMAGSVPKSGATSPTPPLLNGNAAFPLKSPAGERRPGEDTPPDAYTWWLDVLAPTDEEMKLLSKVFNIHPLTTEDIQMEETREKIELFRSYYFVCFRGFDQDPYSPTHLEPLNMYIIVFRDGILSFHFRPTPHPQNVRRRIKQLKDYISVTSDWISYALIDDITDAFGPLIQGIEYEVDSIDELVLILREAEQSDMLRRIGTCRKKVMGLLRLMGNKADVVKGLAKRCNENWRVAPTSDIGLYLSDIQDHLITMTQNLNHYEKILSRSHSNYLAQISIEMTDANNQINDVLSKLTALGTVLIPMNLVTGLWGMNVHVPGQDVENLHWFSGIIAVLAAFAVIAGWSTYKLMVRR